MDANWALVLTSLFGALLVVLQLRDSTKARREQNQILVRQETLRIFVSTLDVRTPRGVELPDDRDPDAVHKFILRATNEPTVDQAIRSYLNYWELVAAGALGGLLDTELLRRLSKNRVIALWNAYHPYIAGWREKDADANLWHQLEKLVASWTSDSDDSGRRSEQRKGAA